MPRRRHHQFLILCMVAGAALLGAGFTACEPPPDTYVALGDSYVAGPLIPNQSTNPPGCLRSDHNYASLVRTQIKVTKFRDVSCSGATTDDLFATQDLQFGADNPPQLDALDRQTKVVTLGIGGNDIGFTDIVVNCSTQNPTGPGCKSTYVHDGRDELSERIAAAGVKVDRSLAAINARAPRATVFMVGYPTVLPNTGTGCYPTVPVLPGDVVYLRAKVRELNATLQARAEAAGATYIDLARPSIAHDFCQLPTRKWVEGITPTAPAAPVHPNAAGMQGASVTVTASINQKVTS